MSLPYDCKFTKHTFTFLLHTHRSNEKLCIYINKLIPTACPIKWSPSLIYNRGITRNDKLDKVSLRMCWPSHTYKHSRVRLMIFIKL